MIRKLAILLTFTFPLNAFSQNDADLNYKGNKIYNYDQTGNSINSNGVVSEGREYFNSFHSYQSQVKQFRYAPSTYGHVLVSEKEHDARLRFKRNFLPTPVNKPDLGYESNFAEYTNGDLDQSNQNKAGWYYSDNNLIDIFQDATNFPFSEKKRLYNTAIHEYKNFFPGDPFHINQISDFSYAIPANNELEQGHNYSNELMSNPIFQSISDESSISYKDKTMKAISVFTDGKINYQYTDQDGKVLVEAQHGGTIFEGSSAFGRNIEYVNIEVPFNEYETAVELTRLDLQGSPTFNYTLSSWEIVLEIDISGPNNNQIELIELNTDVNGIKSKCNTCLHNGGLSTESNFYYSRSDQSLDNNGIPITDIQLRSFVPFKVNVFHILYYDKVFTINRSGSSSNSSQGPVAPEDLPYAITKAFSYQSESNDIQDHMEVFVWNDPSSFVTFPQNQNVKIKVTDLFKESNEVIYSNNWSQNFDLCSNQQNCLVDKPTILRFEVDESNLDWSELQQTPYNDSYDDDFFSVDYAYTQNNPKFYLYDDIGNLRYEVESKSISEGINEWKEYKYDSRGNIIYVDNPDKGISNFVYNKIGQLRFSQDPKQAQNNYFTYLNYDSRGRLIEKGEFHPAQTGDPDMIRFFETHDDFKNNGPIAASGSIFEIINNVGSNDGLSDLFCFDVNVFDYDFPAQDCPGSTTQRFLNSKVAKSYHSLSKVASDKRIVKWFSYDEFGRLEWEINRHEGWGTSFSKSEYEYLFNGEPHKKIYTSKDGKRFTHRYEYDEDLNLVKIYTNYSDNTEEVLNVNYQYNLINQIIREELAENQQGIDYVRNINGQLKAINHPTEYQASADNFDDLLRMHFEYYDGDYKKDFSVSGIKSITDYRENGNLINQNDYFDGRMKAMGWKAQNPNFIPGVSLNHMYIYLYDDDRQMTSSVMGNGDLINGYIQFDQYDRYSEYVNYDEGGNISTLTRTNDIGITINDFNYVYNSNNQLGSIINPSSVRNHYYYDAKGNVKRIQNLNNSESNYKDIEIEYYSFDRVKAMNLYKEGLGTRTIEDARIEYTYDVSGRLIKKTYFSSKEESGSSGSGGGESRMGGEGEPETYWVWVDEKIEVLDRDASGSILAEYVELINPDPEIENIQHIKYPFYGIKRLGYYDPELINELNIYDNEVQLSEGEPEPSPFIGDYLYELRDHQENVRVVFMPTIYGPEPVNVKEFYAFGKTYRNFQNYEYNLGYQGLYTRFEVMSQLVEFQARPYDPAIGRWLMTDPQNQFESPYNAMGNLPFMVTDPTGEVVPLVALAVIAAKGMAIGAVSYGLGLGFSPGGLSNFTWKSFGKTLAISGAMSVASFGIGSIFQGAITGTSGISKLGLMATKSIVHATSSSMIDYAIGNEFQVSTFASSAIGSFTGELGVSYLNDEAGMTLATLSGGITAEISGGDFFEGARNAGIITAFNAMLHPINEGDPEKEEPSQTNTDDKNPYTSPEGDKPVAEVFGIQGNLTPVDGWSFEAGVVIKESTGEWRFYLSGGESAGVDASLGVFAGAIKNISNLDFNFDQLNGWGGSDNFGAAIFDFTHGGDNVINPSQMGGDYGGSFYINKVGISIGLPAGYSRQYEKTIFPFK